MGEEGFKS